MNLSSGELGEGCWKVILGHRFSNSEETEAKSLETKEEGRGTGRWDEKSVKGMFFWVDKGLELFEGVV